MEEQPVAVPASRVQQLRSCHPSQGFGFYQNKINVVSFPGMHSMVFTLMERSGAFCFIENF